MNLCPSCWHRGASQVTGDAVSRLLLIQVSDGMVKKAWSLFVTFSFIVIIITELWG